MSYGNLSLIAIDKIAMILSRFRHPGVMDREARLAISITGHEGIVSNRL